jgi:arylsulfatase B/arylsulfatase I/J
MTIYLDSVVNSLVISLKAAGMWNDTVFVYASDNGGYHPYKGYGNNWPKRGSKASLFDGGIKVPAFVHSPLLQASSRGITYDNLMHVTDWLPTLIEGALCRGDLLESSDIPGSARQRQGLDGVNQWSHILSGGGGYSTDSPRGEIMVNLDYLNSTHQWQGFDTAAIIVGSWKLIIGQTNETNWPVPTNDASSWNQDSSVYFNFLFNLADDPNEHTNLYDVYPETVRGLFAAELLEW